MRFFSSIALALLAAATAVPLPARAQSHRPAFGLYAGVDNSTMKGDSVPGPLHKSGFLGGAFLTWALSDRLALQPELVFAQKGVTTLDARPKGIVSTDIRVSYVEIPLLLRINGAALHGGVTPFALLGPEIALKAACSVAVGGLSGRYTCKDVGDGLEAGDFGGIAGAGIDFRIGTRIYSLSARYDYGMSNVVKNNAAKNLSFGVLLGMRL